MKSRTGVGRQEFLGAQRLLGVSHSDSEVAELLEDYESMLDPTRRLRHAVDIPAGVCPATGFRAIGEVPKLVNRIAFEASTRDIPMADAERAGSQTSFNEDDIAYASLADLAHWLRTTSLTSVELTRIYLRRIERFGVDPLNCIAERLDDRALAQAQAMDDELAAGAPRSLLHGIPYGLKDLVDVDGVPTRWGAEIYRDRVGEDDATVYERLAAAGAVLVAKLSLGRLAVADKWYDGMTRNPWHTDEGSLGSSAGPCAATAAGLVGFAIGSETLGSIQTPSDRCGNTGLRPTFGRVSRAGCMMLAPSLDKLGPITRQVEDALIVLDAIHGADDFDPDAVTMPLDYVATEPTDGYRIGWVRSWFEDDDSFPCDRDTLAAAQRAGFTLVELPDPDLPTIALHPIFVVESGAQFEDITLSGLVNELPGGWPRSFRSARFISAVDYVQAQRLRRMLAEAFDEIFVEHDLGAIMAPFSAPFLGLSNYSGHPSLTLRAQFHERTRIVLDENFRLIEPDSQPTIRVPRGITLYGRLFDEGRLCRIGKRLESQLDVWHERPL